MPTKKKLLVLLPDGIGLRNFVFSDFPKIVDEKNLNLTYWNGTDFDLSRLNLEAIRLKGNVHYKTDLLKKARKEIEIRQFIKKFNNKIYWYYLFKNSQRNIKSYIKKIWLKKLIFNYQNDLNTLREKIKSQERKTPYYKNCIHQIRKEKPDLLFCTNQRPVNAISPIIAAQDLGIPTATFIFSWDNIPKATMVIETDYYFVWSNHMADELKNYYSYIRDEQIIVTGSPQFEMHFKNEIRLDKKTFCKAYNIPLNKDFLCFSGDDITTSPHDPTYLEDVCQAVKVLNANGHNYHLIFRPCPVDFSDRYDDVLNKNKDVVTRLRPAWEKQGEVWNTVFPTKDDETLLYNTIEHSDLIINLGSSMVFDAYCHNKTCAYIKYNPTDIELKKDVNTVYKYVHFQSMPTKDAVVWLNSKAEISDKILKGIQQAQMYTENAESWFKCINEHPPQYATTRLTNAILNLMNTK